MKGRYVSHKQSSRTTHLIKSPFQVGRISVDTGQHKYLNIHVCKATFIVLQAITYYVLDLKSFEVINFSITGTYHLHLRIKVTL